MTEEVGLSVIVPAYNEAAAIGRTLEAMRAFLEPQPGTYEIIVAVDGTDDTAGIVAAAAKGWPDLFCTVERGRHGKGHGIHRGVRLARGSVVGFIDADYKTPIEEATKLLPLLNQGYDLVIGSRAVDGARVEIKQPRYRQIGSRLFVVAMHAIVGLEQIADTQCGFKFFTREAALAIFSRARIDGYMCDVEMLWPAQRLGYKVKEVGIRWRDDGDSRLPLITGNLTNGLDLVRIRFGRYA